MAEHDDRIRLRHEDAELEGERLGPGPADLRLLDVALRDCDLSNVDAAGGTIVRVEARGSRLTGIALEDGEVRGSRFSGCTLSLASLARSTVREVRFEDCDLREASFMGARLIGVSFDRCRLEGADFREAQIVAPTAIRGSSLDGVLGLESLRGLRMPWEDIVGSAGALAAELGIEVEEPG